MATVEYIVKRVRAGDKIKFCVGFYGAQTVILTRGRLIRRKYRFDMSAVQVDAVKRLLWPARYAEAAINNQQDSRLRGVM